MGSKGATGGGGRVVIKFYTRYSWVAVEEQKNKKVSGFFYYSFFLSSLVGRAKVFLVSLKEKFVKKYKKPWSKL